MAPEYLSFQALCWRGRDEYEDADDEEPGVEDASYKIQIFGKTENGLSVCLSTDYFPCMYVMLPDDYDSFRANSFVRNLKNSIAHTRRTLVSFAFSENPVLFGFRNGRRHKFLRLSFKSRRAMYSCRKMVEEGKVDKKIRAVHESGIDPVLRFVHQRNLKTAGWLRVPKSACSLPDCEISICDVEWVAPWTSVEPDDRNSIAPFVIASFDIEVHSPDGTFPEAHRDECKVAQIGLTLQRYGDAEPFSRVLMSVGTCAPIEGVDVRNYASEKLMLEAWPSAYKNANADVLLSWNAWGFDSKYMYDRAKKIGCSDSFFEAGKIEGENCELVQKTLSSSAYGHNDFFYVDTPGIFQIDGLALVRKEHK